MSMSLPPEIIEQFREALVRYKEIKGRGAQKQLAISYQELIESESDLQPYFSDLIKGKKPAATKDTQEKIAKAAGYKYEDFLNLAPRRRSQKQRPQRSPEQNLVVEVINGFEKLHLEERADHYRGVPLYESGKLAAFSGGYTFNENEIPEATVVVYRPELHGRVSHDLRALRVGGNSMEPIIPEGSIVIVDLNDRECIDKKFYVVRDPRDPDPSNPVSMVKRVRKVEQEKFQGFALVSENRDHLPIVTDAEWNSLVIGRVVWMWRSLEDV